MKKEIIIKIPDWVKPQRIIRVFAGMDLMAVKPPYKPVETKIIPCNYCGDCCTWHNCEHTVKDGEKILCSLYSSGRVPFVCAGTRPDLSKFPRCSVRWE